MSTAKGRREAPGETGRGMSRRRLLGLGLLSADRAAGSPAAAPRGGADRRRAADAAPTPAGELKNPAEFKAPEGQGEQPDHALVLAVRRLPRRCPEVHRRGVQEATRPQPLARDHGVSRAERAAGRREVGAGGPEPDARHHRRRAGRLRRRRLHERQRARLHQGLRRGSRLQARLLAQRARAADDQRRDRLGAGGHQHGDRLLQPRALPAARPRGARTRWTS